MNTIVSTRQRISTVYIILEFRKGLYIDCIAFSNLKKAVIYLTEKGLIESSYHSVLRYMHKDGSFRFDADDTNYKIIGKKVR